MSKRNDDFYNSGKLVGLKMTKRGKNKKEEENEKLKLRWKQKRNAEREDIRQKKKGLAKKMKGKIN